MVGSPYQSSGTGRETLSEFRKWSETIFEVWSWSGDPPEVRKWSGDPSGVPEVVGTPSQRSGTGRETLTEVRKWSKTIEEVWN